MTTATATGGPSARADAREAATVVSSPRRRGRRQRREIPDHEAVRAALALSRRRDELERRIAAMTAERLPLVLELRIAGLSHLEIGELLRVSKGRAQQLEHEAHSKGTDHDHGRCPYCLERG